MNTLPPQVNEYNKSLNNLSQWWQKVTLIGKINSQAIATTLIDDMGGTRKNLEKLQEELINSLVRESMQKLEQELEACSQVAIDILIRNLFERTADVGFLATDDDLRGFLTSDSNSEQAKATIEARLHEYTLKYSVYDEIIILDPKGQVMVHLDQNNLISQSFDSLIEETINSDAPYIETFRHSDLQPQLRHSLIYSARINESNDLNSPLLGILCLCFRFDDEMTGIFENLQQGEEEVIAILDENGQVIASNNQQKLSLDSKVNRHQDDALITLRSENTTFFAKSLSTSGYQGFYGLSWKGYTLQSYDNVFSEGKSQDKFEESAFKDSNLFPSDLREISHAAATIIDDLILIVLNGQIISAKRDANEFMPVLSEIRNIGKEIKSIFDESISNLYNTVLSSLMSSVQFQARLAVDIMDRNLYERANDVRWWALTTRFRELMAEDMANNDHDVLASILSYINELYTVYTNLFLYDLNGKIMAVSNVEERNKLGINLDQGGHFKKALNVKESQEYIVSPFEKTELYGDRHTYIYLTSIMDKENINAVGGIGIVFDSEPEFQAILEDSLPRDKDGDVIDGAFALFCDRHQSVISSTSAMISVGDSVSIEQEFIELEKGQSISVVTSFKGKEYAIGCAMSQGYREYKTSGDYENDILSLIFVPI